MSPSQAGQIQNNLRRLKQRGLIDTYDFAVADIMLFLFRKPGHGSAIAALKAIARMSGVGLTRVKTAISKLHALKIFVREQRRQRFFWGHNRRLVASRQDKNIYHFVLPSTEVAGRPARRQDSRILSSPPPLGGELATALTDLGARIAAKGDDSS